MNHLTLPQHIDPNKLAHTLWLRRKELRELPLAIDISLSLTRDMLTELFEVVKRKRTPR